MSDIQARSIDDDLAAGEERLTVEDVTRSPLVTRNGRKLHYSAPYRWMRGGVKVGGRRVVLESRRLPGGIITTPSAIARFISSLNAPSAPAAPALQSPSKRRRSFEAAERQLEKAGI